MGSNAQDDTRVPEYQQTVYFPRFVEDFRCTHLQVSLFLVKVWNFACFRTVIITTISVYKKLEKLEQMINKP